MNPSETNGSRFVYFIMLVSLFLTSGLLGFEKTFRAEDHKNHLSSLSLIGVLVSENPSSSLAVVHNKATGKTIILASGESIFDMSLTHVLEDGIVLSRGDKIYWILMGNGKRHAGDGKKRRITPRVLEADQGYDQPNGSRADNLPKIELSRSEVQRRVKRDLPLIIKDTQVVPNNVDGKINGFRVVRLPGKGIASEIGIFRDDVIMEVNGVKLDNLSTLVSLYSRIFMEDRFEVLIERDKKFIRQVYTLR